MSTDALNAEEPHALIVPIQKLNTNTLTKMEILKHGKMIKEAECPECHCLFTYNKTRDVHYTYNYDREHTLDYSYVSCPECNLRVKVDEDKTE